MKNNNYIYPLIVKSGLTYVKKEYEGGMNYICLNPGGERCLWLWKPFSEIREEGLTDEIAKLRPLVINVPGVKKELEMLFGVFNNILILYNWSSFHDNYRLATALEIIRLQDEKQ